ncbi:hypothetical protein [Pantoea sp. At-9b]|jgi:hypothetical protein|uniref:hypothetical protein n=1 Tax=Pantoea sp. (strain At-9b) TaxID=592316 RepID=UPI0001B3F4F5|nr:hypothetical protein [Pantoea sp. At-9b]ADU69458.1 hypothetical protein Pat9b_2146 [Pantoea sp. At-9b]
MESTAIASNSVRVNCKPEALESFFHREAISRGNKSLALEMGIHPSRLSRQKISIFELACRMIHELGLPQGSVAAPGGEQNVILTGEEARKLLSMLEHLREPAEGAGG